MSTGKRLKAAVEGAKASVELAAIDLSNTRITAPRDGVVEPYPMSRDQRDLGDALAHGAGADDGHGAAEVECCHVRDPPARGCPQMRRTPLSRPIVRLL